VTLESVSYKSSCKFNVAWVPSLLSGAAQLNDISMMELLLAEAADCSDSFALFQSVKHRALRAIKKLLKASKSMRRRPRKHYGSAALRETIRMKWYDMTRLLASSVYINGTEEVSGESIKHRTFSPLGEAIFRRDHYAIRTFCRKSNAIQIH